MKWLRSRAAAIAGTAASVATALLVAAGAAVAAAQEAPAVSHEAPAVHEERTPPARSVPAGAKATKTAGMCGVCHSEIRVKY
ncbi:MAG TPA: hypothetical protein VFM17_05550, partial [Candidatus Eisenbacteria bacterium]|nr:hypothetical protein [Candidatus Eisenbacteria bacterium]